MSKSVSSSEEPDIFRLQKGETESKKKKEKAKAGEKEKGKRQGHLVFFIMSRIYRNFSIISVSN